MVFSSITFLYYFLPILLIIYFIVPFKFKNIILLIASLFFYFYAEPVYLIIMIASIVSGYIHGICITITKKSKYKKITLFSSIVFSLGTLIIFKYSDFIIKNINLFKDNKIELLNIALPIGISFYTFQIMSYAIDVYRKKVKVQKNIIKFATYVSLFPQLIAGPIVRYSNIEKELAKRKISFGNLACGINRFIIGLSKKVLLANTFGELVKTMENINEKTVMSYWIWAIAFTLQIYFDFSGYSDMAIGIGRMLGFHFPENFNYPYISKSITEFWRRWHISLGSWFRDYLYIPLGGNRVDKVKWVRNIIVVWFLTGLWHGARWNFIIWGLYFAVFLVAEKYFLYKLLNKAPKVIRHFYVTFFIIVGFVIFNSNGLNNVFENIRGMFGNLEISIANEEILYYLKSYSTIVLIGIIASTPLTKRVIDKIKKHKNGKRGLNIVEPLFCILLIFVITGYLIDGSFNPFLYFRF